MERYYALPIAFAAAFDAALLFGFSKPSPRAVPSDGRIYCPFPVMPPVEDDPPVAVDSGEQSSQPKEVIDRPLPTSPSRW